jgi:hypothetical protein|tara:strand:+ start:12744 stop:13130 length:387 start_codon:yes stop_codon:yes gene_type:complete
MPVYVYKHPDEEEYREVFQGMNDEHSYEEGGINWERVFLAPNASVDSDIDPFSNQSFIDATYKKKGTYGDLLDYSKEQSERRATQRDGVDPVKEQYYKNYAAERGGKKHIREIKEKGYESKNVKIDYD